MKAGAVNGGLNYLYDTLGTSPTGRPSQPGIGVLAGAAMGRSIASRDPRSGCHNGPGYSRGNTAYGYQYNENQTGKGRGFNLLDFGKALLTGGLVGGASSAAFYGAGKAVEALSSSLQGAHKGSIGYDKAYYHVTTQENAEQTVIKFNTNASFEPDVGNAGKSIADIVVQTTDGQRVPISIKNANIVGFKKEWWEFWKK